MPKQVQVEQVMESVPLAQAGVHDGNLTLYLSRCGA